MKFIRLRNMSGPFKSVRTLAWLLLITGMLQLSACDSGSDPARSGADDLPPSTETVSCGTASLQNGEPEDASQINSSHTDNRPETRPGFYLGVDLSYVNEMDDCGAVYLENGEPQDVFQLFSTHGAILVRARIWHDPDWTEYSDLADITRTFRRATEAGMFTLLDFHYSDNWADPGKQAIPAAWKGLDDEGLEQAVYDYTYQVLTYLHQNQVMPDFVQVGNETNSGMLKQVMELDWPRDAKLFNAGIRAVRDAAKDTKTDPKIILHVAQPENAGWWFRGAQENGITDFDIIGLSYYAQWSSFTVPDLGAQVTYLRQTFQKEVMIVETAYPWTMDAVDETASNTLNQGVRGYSFTPEGQRQFMVDLTQLVISNGGLGVVYWEPAWVSTKCSTRWGQGSHWENATFFDFKKHNEVHQGIEFLSYPYLYPDELVDGVLEESYGQPLIEDPVGDNLDQVKHLDLISLHARDGGDYIYLGLTVGGDLFADPWGSFLIYIDTTQDDQGAEVDVDRRPITVSEPYLPEFRIDIQALDRKSTVSASIVLNAWDGAEWNLLPLPAGMALQNGSPSVIELLIPKILLGQPEFVNLAVVSTGRGRVHTAGDVLGDPVSAADWKEPVTLDIFGRLDLVYYE
jgi:arabinogalactan endo-1,4-beta-galactosidase